MKPPTWGALIGLGLSAVASAEEAKPRLVDLLAFSNGGLVEHVTSSYGGGWLPEWLIDEDPAHGWASPENAKPPFDFVFSLPERSRIDRVGFSTAAVEQADEAAKDIEILVSDVSATAGFASAGTVTLAQAADDQGFDLPKPAVGRWIKVVITSNHGSPRYTEIMDMHAYGMPLTTTPLPDMSGTYASEAYGKFHLSQAGAQLEGCYEYHDGLVQGGLDSHLMRLTWSEYAGKDGAQDGPAVMVLARDGKQFEGWWKKAGESDWHTNWRLKKISDQVGSCPHWRPAGAKGGIVAASLAARGRVRLYGITFDTDSDRLRPDAKPTLDELLTALKANASWKVTVEGYTDSTATPEHNLDLSRRRSAAVKAYLTSAGIAADRLDTIGFGQDNPAADNATALGRAQNRRVEVVRK